MCKRIKKWFNKKRGTTNQILLAGMLVSVGAVLLSAGISTYMTYDVFYKQNQAEAVATTNILNDYLVEAEAGLGRIPDLCPYGTCDTNSEECFNRYEGFKKNTLVILQNNPILYEKYVAAKERLYTSCKMLENAELALPRFMGMWVFGLASIVIGILLHFRQWK